MRGKIIFRLPEQQEYFESLGTLDEKENFLIGLSNQRLAALLSSENARLLLRLISNPNLAVGLKSVQISSLGDFLEEIGSIWNKAVNSIMRLRGSGHYYDDISFWDYAKSTVNIALPDANPALKTLFEGADRLSKRFEAKAPEFILMIGGLNPEVGRELACFFELITLFFNTAQKSFDVFAKTLGDPNRIGIGESKGVEPTIVYATVFDGDVAKRPPHVKPEKGRPSSEDKIGRKGKKTRKEDKYTDKSRAPYRLSPEAMVRWVLQLEDNGHRVKRWDASLSREFRRLNRDGEYDYLFLRLYSRLLSSYKLGQITHQNPVKNFYALIGDEMVMRKDMTPKDKLPPQVPYDIALILNDIVGRMIQNEKLASK